ncbi:MAG: hypothetical protein HDS35_07635 [Bacteroides sp.]|nr:hypothetical protein [Bacteroides sp.]
MKSLYKKRRKSLDTPEYKALKKIESISPSEKKSVGDIMVECEIIAKNCYLLLYDKSLSLFIPHNFSNSETDAQWQSIFHFIGQIDQLTKEGILLKVDEDYQNWLYGNRCDCFKEISKNRKYKAGRGIIVEIRSKREMIIEGQGEYREVSIATALSNYLINWITGDVYPTSDYSLFMERRNLTPTQYSLKLSKQSNIWATMAFIISIFGILIDPFWSNKFGYSTLNSTQFTELIDSIHINSEKLIEFHNETSERLVEIDNLLTHTDSILTEKKLIINTQSNNVLRKK